MENTIKNKLEKQVKKNAIFKQQSNVVWKSLPELFFTLIILLSIASAALFFLNYKYFTVEQNSMQPLINNYNDSSITDGVFAHTSAAYDIGDVVVLSLNNNVLLKRIVAMPNDKIAIERRFKAGSDLPQYVILKVSKGGTTPHELDEPYLPESAKTIGMASTYGKFQTYLETASNTETIGGTKFLVLEEDEFFYLGDNRLVSEDSSKQGPAKLSTIIGKVEILVKKEQNMLFHILSYILGFKKV